MPNRQDIGTILKWRNFRANVRQIEAITGPNFSSNVRPTPRLILRIKKDNPSRVWETTRPAFTFGCAVCYIEGQCKTSSFYDEVESGLCKQ
jgi:hypothetical protein